MGQKITTKIAEQEYVMNAPTPRDEEDIRLAASVINRQISGYITKYPGRQMTDILSFVALNESISSIALQRRLNAVKEEADTLRKDMGNYIEEMEK